MAKRKDLFAMFTTPDNEPEPEQYNSIEKDFVEYINKHNETYHSPNMSPSSPINNGAVSE
jgi:hypothetical protein